MTTTRTTTVILPGILRSEGGQLQRNCKVRVNRHEIHVNERAEPVNITYSGLSIADSDDWPDGDYKVTYADQKELLTKKDGDYRARGAF